LQESDFLLVIHIPFREREGKSRRDEIAVMGFATNFTNIVEITELWKEVRIRQRCSGAWSPNLLLNRLILFSLEK
jgi:hypothetical protein